MKKAILLKSVFVAVSFAVSVVSIYLGETSLPGIRLLCLPLFFGLFAGIFAGPFQGMLAGVLPPVLATALLPKGEWDLYLLQQVLSFGTTALLGGLLFRRLRTGDGTALLGVLAGRIIWGLTGLLVSYVAYLPYSWTDFVKGAFFDVWAGLVLAVFGIPILVFFARKINLFKLLGNRAITRY